MNKKIKIDAPHTMDTEYEVEFEPNYNTEQTMAKHKFYWSSVLGAWLLGLIAGWLLYHLFMSQIILP